MRVSPKAPGSAPGDRWHLDDVFLSIYGKLRYLWRAVDQDGEVLDILVQPRRSRQAAKKLFRKLLRGLQYIPRATITDKLGSYAAAKTEVVPDVLHIRRGLVAHCTDPPDHVRATEYVVPRR